MKKVCRDRGHPYPDFRGYAEYIYSVSMLYNSEEALERIENKLWEIYEVGKANQRKADNLLNEFRLKGRTNNEADRHLQPALVGGISEGLKQRNKKAK